MHVCTYELQFVTTAVKTILRIVQAAIFIRVAGWVGGQRVLHLLYDLWLGQNARD